MKNADLGSEPIPAVRARTSDVAATQPYFASLRWTRKDGWLLAYLFFPVPIFLLGYFSPLMGVPAALLAVVGFLVARPFEATEAPRRTVQSLSGLLVLLVFAAAWTSLGGAGHLFHANAIDWVPRYGVLRDLVVYDWPPRYLDTNGIELVLRAPLGYYLVPALAGKLVGIAWADLLLLLWTWLGVSLFFLANIGGTPRKRFLILTLFAIASGLDILGYLWMSDGYLPNLGYHIEWWTNRMKYSSNSTMLYWIPNHVIPGWALGAWLWRSQHSIAFLRRLPVIGLAVMLWSPLPFVGALPMIGVLVWRFRRKLSIAAGEVLRTLAYVLFPAALIGGFLLMSIGGIRSWAVIPPAGVSIFFLEVTLMFILLEVLVFGAFAFRVNQLPALSAGLITLCLLPFVAFGPTNDLLTLGGIPILTLIWLTLINELVAPCRQRRLSSKGRALLMALFLVGAVTPFQETWRAVTEKRWAPDPDMPAPVAINGFPAHYYASAEHGFAVTLKLSPPLPAAAMDWRKARNY